MRILVDSGDYRCTNMGDLAMLQIAVSRLGRLFPGAVIQTITANPELIADQVPGTSAVPQQGLQAWLAERYLLGRLHDAIPKSASREIGRVKGALRRRWPGLIESMIKARMRLTGVQDRNVLEFLESFHAADLVVLCGQGGINDNFYKHALAVLEFIDMSVRSGKPTALFGQGIGPIASRDLLSRAKSVLGGVGLVAVREGRFGPSLLRSMNVPPERIINTGDDAIELAYEARPKTTGEAIGVNIRAADHTGISPEQVNNLRPAFRSLVERCTAPLLPLPISRYPDCKDARDIHQLLSGISTFDDNGRELDTPAKVILQAGRCRIVITAAYHAAVFALSQGVPVVALAGSRYCLKKFQGLAHQFRTGIEILLVDSESLESELAGAAERAWRSAETVRDSLLEAAARQIRVGHAAYRMTTDLVSRMRNVA
jgi:polysaccharide pyruvyl transferase WcaK-like protein